MPRTTRNTSTTLRRAATAAVEGLEDRRLFAAGNYVTLDVAGTDAADSIVIAQTNNTLHVTVNGVEKTYSTKSTQIGDRWTTAVRKVVVDAGKGNDSVLADNTVTVPIDAYGGDGDDTVRGGAAADALYGGRKPTPGGGPLSGLLQPGVDTLQGGDGNDALYASSMGGDRLEGGAGDDAINGSFDADHIEGNDGNDTILSGNGGDDVSAGNGNDHVEAGTGDDTVYGGNGLDWIDGGAGNDTLYGNAGNDFIRGGNGDDHVLGGADNDTLFGDGPGAFGFDVVEGGSGNDFLDGGDMADTLKGDGGNDRLVDLGYGGNTVVYGGLGKDTADFSAATADVEARLDWGTIAVLGTTTFWELRDGVEQVNGGSGNDRIVGTNAAETFHGNGGNDEIRSGGGDDVAYGEAGDDRLFGDRGADTLWGGGGDDYLNAGAGNAVDRLYAGDGDDTLVALGGGTADVALGNAGWDTFWVDDEASEVIDDTSAERSSWLVNRVAGVYHNMSMELEGQDLPDPGLPKAGSVIDILTGNVTPALTYTRFDAPLFNDGGPIASDVNQGMTGDCSFMATLAAYTGTHPSYVERSVVDFGDGTYGVRLFNDAGKRWYYRVDNELAVADGGYQPYFGRLGNGAIWSAVVEKAMAWHNGDTYAKMWSLDPAHCLRVFGPNAQDEWDSGVDDTIALLKTRLDQGDTIVAASETDATEACAYIRDNHAYAVVSVRWSDKTVLVYNPWGKDADATKGMKAYGADDGYVRLTAGQFNAAFRNLAVAYT